MTDSKTYVISGKRPAPAPASKPMSAHIRHILGRLRSVMFGQIGVVRSGREIKLKFGGAKRVAPAPALANAPLKPGLARKVEAEAPTPRERSFAIMVSELSISLSANPRNRTGLRYLTLLESLLVDSGVDGFEDISLSHCRKARKQLDTLMAVAPSPGLRDLAARLDVTILIRDVDVRSGPDAGPTDFGTYTGPRSNQGLDSGFHVGGVRL